MGFIIAVKERQNNTDNMFDPLKQTIELLKSYDHEMSEDVYQLLADLPEKWTNTKKTMVTVKQEVAPLQAIEVADIRRKCTSFDVQQVGLIRKSYSFLLQFISDYSRFFYFLN